MSVSSVVRNDLMFIILLMSLGGVFFCFAYAGWGLIPGREYWAYLQHYFGLKSGTAMFRPVASSYLIGWLFELGRPGALWVLALLYQVFLFCVYYTSSLFGKTTARIVALIMVFNMQVTLFFTKMDGDLLLCLSIAFWSATLVRFFRVDKYAVNIMLGLLVFLPTLSRQTAIVYFIAAAFPIFCFGFSKDNLRRSLIMIMMFSSGILFLLSYNYTQFGIFSFPQLKGYIPSFHVYRYGAQFSPDYGPENRKLLDLLDKKILSHKIYVENGVDREKFFLYNKDVRKFTDLLYLEKIVEPNILTRASIESILANPTDFIRSCASMMFHIFTKHFSPPLPIAPPPQPSVNQPIISKNAKVPANVPVINSPSRPNPVRIPTAFSSTPEAMTQLGMMNTKAIKNMRNEIQEIKDNVIRVQKGFFNQGSYSIAYSVKYFMIPMTPPMLFFLMALFLLPFAKYERSNVRLLMVMVVPALGIIFASGLVHQLQDYRIPFDFLIVLGGVVGLQYNPLIRKIFS